MFAEKNVLNYLCNLIILLHGGYPFLLSIFTYEKGHEYWKNEMIEMNILENKKNKNIFQYVFANENGKLLRDKNRLSFY